MVWLCPRMIRSCDFESALGVRSLFCWGSGLLQLLWEHARVASNGSHACLREFMCSGESPCEVQVPAHSWYLQERMRCWLLQLDLSIHLPPQTAQTLPPRLVLPHLISPLRSWNWGLAHPRSPVGLAEWAHHHLHLELQQFLGGSALLVKWRVSDVRHGLWQLRTWIQGPEIYIYIYIYAGQSVGVQIWPLVRSQFGALFFVKRFFLQNGAPWVTVRGPQRVG